MISVGKLNEAGCDVVLNKTRPRIITKKGETIRLKRRNGVFLLTMWVKIPDKAEEGGTSKAKHEDRIAPVFARPEK